MTLGASVAGLVQTLGAPASVETSSAGNRFAFPAAAAYADDDAIVRAVDATRGDIPVEIDGKTTSFAIGRYPLARADADLATYAEYASDMVRTYRLSPVRELVLVFAKPAQTLTRVVYGERGTIARMGLLPDDSAKAIPYVAPRMLATAIAGTSGTQTTIVKIQIDRYGTVTDVTIVTPSSDAAFDGGLKAKMLTDKFVPAKLGGRAIAGTVFRELRH